MGTTNLSFSDRIVIENLITEKRFLQYIADFLRSTILMEFTVLLWYVYGCLTDPYIRLLWCAYCAYK